MNFDRLDLAKETLKSLSMAVVADDYKRPADDDNFHIRQHAYDDLLNNNLMYALTHNSPEFVKLYLDYGASVSQLKPTHPGLLHTHREQVAKLGSDKRRTKDRRLRRQLPQLPLVALAVEELYEAAGQSSHSHVGALVDKSKYA